MDDTNDTPQPDTEDAAPQTDQQPDTLPDTAPDWQALAHKWEKQAKNDRTTLEGLKRKMQGLLTPEQVADTAEQAAAAARDAADAKQEALRLRVALDTGVPAHLADRLVGATREDLEADAKTLLDLIGKPPRAVPDASAGTGKGKPADPKPDPNQLLRSIVGGA